MQKLQDFQLAARENGFVETGESEEGSTVWFRNATPDAGTDVHKRLCIDSLTNSATVFWETLPSQDQLDDLSLGLLNANVARVESRSC